jgi:ABC-type uncharacterized transport system ATPase subunit
MESTAPASARIRDGVPLLEMRGITKRFAGVVADDGVDFDVRAGEIHSLFGENGAGKSTLMRVLYGFHHPDAGEIRIDGSPVAISSPADAIRHGVGMIHQHFMLVNTLTVADNVALGLRSSRGPFSDPGRVAARIRELSEAYHLKVEPQAFVWQLSVGERQRVEIVKALYRNVSLLILDEPTAVLTPREVDDLFAVLRRMAVDGKGLVFISHKVREVLGLSDRITVLRAGRNVGTLPASSASRDQLVQLMVGHALPAREPAAGVPVAAPRADVASPVGGSRAEGRLQVPPPGADAGGLVAGSRADAPDQVPPPGAEPVAPTVAPDASTLRLAVRDLTVRGDRGADTVRALSLDVRSGEIVGIAGVSGNGQRELAEAIAGLRKPSGGSIMLEQTDLAGQSPARGRAAGLGYVPEERMRDGVVPDFNVAENLLLVDSGNPAFSRLGFLRSREIRRHCAALVAAFDIRTPSLETPARTLSGGNIQKLIMARELSREPRVLLVAQPTRGIDVAAGQYIHDRLRDQRARGTGVLIISEDLDEVMSLADRILVMYEGAIIGESPPGAGTRETIGLMMAGVRPAASREDASVDASDEPDSGPDAELAAEPSVEAPRGPDGTMRPPGGDTSTGAGAAG